MNKSLEKRVIRYRPIKVCKRPTTVSFKYKDRRTIVFKATQTYEC